MIFFIENLVRDIFYCMMEIFNKYVNLKQNNKLDKMFKNGSLQINYKDKYGLSFLHRAIEHSNAEDVIILLIKNGININNQDNCRDTPLSFCIRGPQNPKYTKILLENGADFNTVDKDNISPLFLSVIMQTPVNLKLLLMYGANPNEHNKENFSVLDYTLYLYLEDICYNDDEEQEDLYIEMIKLLVLYGADLNCVNKYKDYKYFKKINSIIRRIIPFENAEYILRDE